MKTATIEINGEEHTIQELRSRNNAAWRQSLQAHFDEIASLLEADVADGQALADVVRSVSGKLVKSVDLVRDLVARYAPDLPLDEAYDSEVIEAFAAVLALAYPFGGALERLIRSAGSLKQMTTQN